MGRLFLGVDGGQSSTKAVIGDESGRILGRGSGGPCNHVGAAEGRVKLVGAITACLQMACEAAGLDPNGVRFRAACFGMSGGPADKQAILAEILPADQLVVTHDALIALTGATAGEPGIIAIAGTGSIAFGRNASGRTARAGGWGYVFGDEGGGFDITREALRVALRLEEGWGSPTRLLQDLLAATGSPDANDLLHRFYTPEFSRPDVAAFSKLVDAAARDGDEVATKILEEAAGHLAALVASVRQQLFKRGEAVRVSHVGGVFRSDVLRARFHAIVEGTEGNRCAPPVYSPAIGALLEAYRAAGIRTQLE